MKKNTQEKWVKSFKHGRLIPFQNKVEEEKEEDLCCKFLGNACG